MVPKIQYEASLYHVAYTYIFYNAFSRFRRVEKVKISPKKSPDGGLAAFVDFVDIRSATKANKTTFK